jgi:hypothetical protein
MKWVALGGLVWAGGLAALFAVMAVGRCSCEHERTCPEDFGLGPLSERVPVAHKVADVEWAEYVADHADVDLDVGIFHAAQQAIDETFGEGPLSW